MKLPFVQSEALKMIRELPESVSSLDLRGNNLGNKSGAELEAMLKALPLSVTSLNLRGNNLGNKSEVELEAMLKALPLSVTSLNLSGNNLGNKSGAELETMFRSLSPQVIELDVSTNSLSKETFVSIVKALPVTVRAIKWDGGVVAVDQFLLLQEDASCKARSAKRLLEYVLKADIKDALLTNVSIAPAYEIDSAMKKELMHLLTGNDDPWSIFVAGLLQEEKINVLYDEGEVQEKHRIFHQEACALSAIDYYEQVLQHPEADDAIKALCYGRLWQMSHEYPLDTVFDKVHVILDSKEAKTVLPKIIPSYDSFGHDLEQTRAAVSAQHRSSISAVNEPKSVATLMRFFTKQQVKNPVSLAQECFTSSVYSTEHLANHGQ